MNLKQADLENKLAGLRKKLEKVNKVQGSVIEIQIRCIKGALEELDKNGGKLILKDIVDNE